MHIWYSDVCNVIISPEYDTLNNIHIQHIVEKTEEDKQKKRELIQAKSQISKLHSDLVNSETTRKRAKLEFEAELDTMKQGHEVILWKYCGLWMTRIYFISISSKIQEGSCHSSH